MSANQVSGKADVAGENGITAHVQARILAEALPHLIRYDEQTVVIKFGGNAMAIKVNIAEQEGAIEVTADMPGCAAEDIDVQLKDGILTIKGEKKVEKDDKQKDYHVMERSYGMFERSFTLPAEVDAAKVEAAFDKGVLKVTLPKLPEAQSNTRKIAVKPKG